MCVTGFHVTFYEIWFKIWVGLKDRPDIKYTSRSGSFDWYPVGIMVLQRFLFLMSQTMYKGFCFQCHKLFRSIIVLNVITSPGLWCWKGPNKKGFILFVVSRFPLLCIIFCCPALIYQFIHIKTTILLDDRIDMNIILLSPD